VKIFKIILISRQSSSCQSDIFIILARDSYSKIDLNLENQQKLFIKNLLPRTKKGMFLFYFILFREEEEEDS